ncbi:MAG: arginine--tRNA ligase [Patescibacteria group bacterium]
MNEDLTNPLIKLQNNLENTVQKLFKVDVTMKFEVPPPQIEADFSISTFIISKTINGNPLEIAKKLADYLNRNELIYVTKISVLGPYINLIVNTKKLYHDILNYIIKSGYEFGKSKVNNRQTALIEFSSPNIAKPLGVGHLRSTIIGHALANIYEWTGYEVVRDNHLGDWGTQFGELIYAYRSWGKDEVINKNPIQELKKLYVKFHQEVGNNPAIKVKARSFFKELENENKDIVVLWKKFKEWSMVDFQKTYKRLGIEFDTCIGESFFAKQTDNVIKECLSKKICKQDPNSPVVFVDSLNDLPSFILRKQDGASLYLTRDLATIKYRVRTYNPNIILYVVGNEQSLHFQQLFALAKQMKYVPKSMHVEHIFFGMVLSKGKKMSTRSGTLVELKEVIIKAVEKSKEILKNSTTHLNKEEKEQIAEIIGLGAIIYNDLHQSKARNISFDFDNMIRLESGSSAYLQYTHVRIASIIDKAGKKKKQHDIAPSQQYSFEHKKELVLAKKLLLFPSIITEAQKTNSPHLICTYLEELAQQFNSFYEAVSVIKAYNEILFISRINLIKATAQVIKDGLMLLGIKVPSKM